MTTNISDRLGTINIEKDISQKSNHNLTPRDQSKKMATRKPGIRCKFYDMGCEFSVGNDQLEDLMSHTQCNTEYHLRLTVEAYKHLKSEQEKIKRKYNKLKFDWNNYHMRLGGYSGAEKLNPPSTSNIKTKKTSQPDLRKLRGKNSPTNKSDSLDVNFGSMKRAKSAEINPIREKDKEEKTDRKALEDEPKSKLSDKFNYFIAINNMIEDREFEEKLPEWMKKNTGPDEGGNVETKL